MVLPCEVLVYNVSHVDLIVSLQEQGKSCIFSRPKFSQFQPISNIMLSAIDTEYPTTIAQGPIHFDDHNTEEEYVCCTSDSDKSTIPIGIRFEPPLKDCKHWSDFHLRGSAEQRMNHSTDKTQVEPPEIDAAYLPVLCQVLPRWLALSQERNAESSKVLFLLAGAGRPRNKDHAELGNSTTSTATIMKRFIGAVYPDVKVIILDSVTGVFRYDENVKFVRSKLLAELETIRSPLAAGFEDNWKAAMHVTIALTEGSPARLGAINASLRMYKPSYLHMWQLKTFWHEHKLIASDLQVQSFEKIETNPAVNVELLDTCTKRLVEEMVKHKRQFELIRDTGPDEHELSRFWLRKTKKPVLSVLMIQREGDSEPSFFRGMNVEVSMPTGSLCSERNVIGTALANDQSLQRLDFKMIAVLSMTLDVPSKQDDTDSLEGTRKRTLSTVSQPTSNDLNPISPCGACQEWLKKISEVNPDFKVVTFPDSECKQAFVSEIF